MMAIERKSMTSRIVATLLMMFLAIYAFWSNALEEGHFFDLFGLLFLVLAIIVWFGWRPICDAFRSARAEAALPILSIARLGSSIMEGMGRPPRDHRRSDEPS
ncbi:MAG: hypothetical protein ACREE1_11595 [Stellaceae bacterium]